MGEAIRSARETKDRAGRFLEIGKSPDVDPVLVEVLYSIKLPLYSDLEISIHSQPSSDLAHGLMSADQLHRDWPIRRVFKV